MKTIIMKLFCRHNTPRTNPSIRLQRTWVNTGMEIIICTLLLGLWASIVAKVVKSGGHPIPTHYNYAGIADVHGSPYWLLLVGAVCTALSIYYMYSVYRPSDMIDSGTKITNMQQAKVAVFWAYIMDLGIIMLSYAIVYSGMEMLSPLFAVALGIMCVASLAAAIATRLLA